MSTSLQFFIIATLLCLGTHSLFSQSVGVGTNNPNSNAALDVVAQNGDQGILLPRLSGSQRLGMSLGNAERGLIVYDTTDNIFYYWDGNAWLRGLGDAASAAFQDLAFAQATALLSIENGNTVDLSSLINDADADPTNEAITDFRITATAIEIEENGAIAGSIPLSSLPSGSDDQQLTRAGNVLNLEDGGSVDLSSILFSGDFGDLTNLPPNLDIDATDDLTAGANISLLNNDAGYITNPADADADPANEAITDFRITATDIEIEENGVVVGSIPLSGLLVAVSTDDQEIDQFELNGASNELLQITLEDDGSGQKEVNLHDITFLGGSDLTGTLGDAVIKPGAVDGTKVQDGSLTSDDIQDNSITSDDLATNAVNSDEIAPGAVTNDKITDVDPSKINQAGASAGDVLKWNGTSWAPGNDLTTGGGPVTSYYAIDPGDFVGLKNNNQDIEKAVTVIFRNENEFVTVREASKAPDILAPVHLPNGSTITGVVIYYMDHAGPDITYDLIRKSFMGGNEVMANWQSAINSGTIQSASLSSIANPVVDNSQYSYRIVFRLSVDNGEVSIPNDAEHRIYGVRIEYTE